MPDTEAFHARIHGRVQGVGFRYSAYQKARSLGISGYVRNDDDGTVEIYAEGSAQALASFQDWLYEGPPGARVDTLTLHKRQPAGHWSGFKIQY
jgi:acylphosphatase